VPDISDMFASTLLYNLELRSRVFYVRFPPRFLWVLSAEICGSLCNIEHWGRSQWLRSLRRGCAAARFPGLRVRIPLEALMCVSCKCMCCQVEASASG
jgi:hypothetical protein